MTDPTWPEQQPQRQDSLDAQLDDLHRVAARLGMYDAADWLWKARAAQREARSGVPGGGEPQPTTSTDNEPVWCVKHRDGWCATKDNHEPEEGGWSVPTRCGYGVTLPGGYDRRQPDCPDCITLAPVRSAGGGDQPDTPCPHCEGTGRVHPFPFMAPGDPTVPCPACTDKENPA